MEDLRQAPVAALDLGLAGAGLEAEEAGGIACDRHGSQSVAGPRRERTHPSARWPGRRPPAAAAGTRRPCRRVWGPRPRPRPPAAPPPAASGGRPPAAPGPLPRRPAATPGPLGPTFLPF